MGRKKGVPWNKPPEALEAYYKLFKMSKDSKTLVRVRDSSTGKLFGNNGVMVYIGKNTYAVS